MPQTCPHCGIALTGVIDAFCPECREDLSATPEEAAAKPTLVDMVDVVQGPAAALGTLVFGLLELVLFLASLLVLFGAMRAGEWEVVGGAAVFLGLAALFLLLKVLQVRGGAAQTSVTGREKTTKGPEQPQ
jgi:hypothetical protein